MKTIILIPARYASSRYPGKPLVMLKGKDGVSKSLIQRSWECAMSVKGVSDVFVLTDDNRIKDAAGEFGAKVIMTSETCLNGTERCADGIEKAGLEADIFINLQGDAPLTPPWFIDALINAMTCDATIKMATPVLRCDQETLNNFKEDRLHGRVGGTTCVFDAHMNALYFSKEVIPYTPQSFTPQNGDIIPVFHHVGVYGYRKSALKAYMGFSPKAYEHYEGLEQLRFLENAIPIRCIEVDARGRVFWELNNPIDVARIEGVL
jgi:3-deoxy-manno-octulosonate cytidylyltransferase (CMP-KDO synthetase)